MVGDLLLYTFSQLKLVTTKLYAKSLDVDDNIDEDDDEDDTLYYSK